MSWITILFFAVGIILVTVSIILTSTFAGSKDTGNELRKALIPIFIVNGIGILLLTIAAFLYFSRNPTYSHLFLTGGFGVSMFISLSALSTAILSQQM